VLADAAAARLSPRRDRDDQPRAGAGLRAQLALRPRRVHQPLADHFGTHGSWEHYLAAKAQLFMHLGPGRTAVLNAADPHALFLDQAIPADVARRWFAAPGPRRAAV
jgi:hypothetical protein